MISQRIVSLKFLGHAIRAARQEKNMSQVELANNLCIKQSTISSIETGETNPRFDTLMKLLTGLDLDIFLKSRTMETDHSTNKEEW